MEASTSQEKEKKSDDGLFKKRPSLLSSEASPTSFRGIINLGIILLVIANFNLIMQNLLKYGILLDFHKFSVEWYRWPALITTLLLNVFLIITFKVEQSIAHNKITEKDCLNYHIVNIFAMVLIPSILVWVLKPNPASGILTMAIATVMTMKMISYAHINHNLRQAARVKKVKNGWPDNISLENIYLFAALPTMVYQQEYPRTEKIRWGFILRRVVEAFACSLMIYVIVEQYIVPLVHNSLEPLHDFDILRIVERIFKLSVPNLYVWLIGFYVIFHLYLNIIGELFRFGDRLFYKDWWNSTCLSQFWRTWNMPVHQWMSVHIFNPALNFGLSKLQAVFACFFISAIFHEVIVGVPFQMIKMWSFFGILGQLPLIYITERLKGKHVGNVIFWVSIMLGQPFIVMIMYREWYLRTYGNV